MQIDPHDGDWLDAAVYADYLDECGRQSDSDLWRMVGILQNAVERFIRQIEQSKRTLGHENVFIFGKQYLLCLIQYQSNHNPKVGRIDSSYTFVCGNSDIDMSFSYSFEGVVAQNKDCRAIALHFASDIHTQGGYR